MGRNSARPPRSDLTIFAGDCRGVTARQHEYAPAECQLPVTPIKENSRPVDEYALRFASRLHPRKARGRVVRIRLTTVVGAGECLRPHAIDSKGDGALRRLI